MCEPNSPFHAKWLLISHSSYVYANSGRLEGLLRITEPAVENRDEK